MQLRNKNGNRFVMAGLVVLFISYNVIIYTKNTSNCSSTLMSTQAIEGEKIWQDNNCTACHQLYGLGGYLGPDLTNIISHPNKGANYAKAFFNSGVKSMPKFNFSEEEKEALVSFLKSVDQTGFYPDYDAKFNNFGWVNINYK